MLIFVSIGNYFWLRVYEVFVHKDTYMMTSSNGNRNISGLLALCAENTPVTSEFPAQRPGARSFDVFFDLRLNKHLAKNREPGRLRRYCAHYDVTVIVMNRCFTLYLAWLLQQNFKSMILLWYMDWNTERWVPVITENKRMLGMGENRYKMWLFCGIGK